MLDAATLTHVARLSRLDIDPASEAGQQMCRHLGSILATARNVAAGEAFPDDPAAGERGSVAGRSAEALADADHADAMAGPGGAPDYRPALIGHEHAALLRKDLGASERVEPSTLLGAAAGAQPPYFAVPKVLGVVAEEG